MVPAMNRRNDDPALNASIIVTSSTTGLLIPPSNIMIIYSMATGGAVSVSAMFLAGVVPGILVGLALMTVAGVLAPQPHGRNDWTLRDAVVRLGRALPALAMVAIVLGGIVGGIFTATEASAVAVLYALLLSVGVYREVAVRDLPALLLRGGVITSVVMLLVGASSAMAWLLAYENVPQTFGTALLSLSDDPIVVLLLINLIMLTAGTVIDMTPAVLLFTPIFWPVVLSLGDRPVALRNCPDHEPVHRPVYAAGRHLPVPRVQCGRHDGRPHAAQAAAFLRGDDRRPGADHARARRGAGTAAVARRMVTPVTDTLETRVERARRGLAGRVGGPIDDVKVVVSPYRVCPIGAHIDHQGGPVLAMGISAYSLVAFAPARSGDVVLTSDNFPGEVRFDLAEPVFDAEPAWGRYAVGAARALGEHHRARTGLVGHVGGSLPGGGLSSSASVVLAYLVAFASVNGVTLDPHALVTLALRAELDFVGVKVGILDPAAIVGARRQHLLEIEPRDARWTPLPLGASARDYTILLVFSGVTRDLSGTDFNRRVEECFDAARELAARAGRDGVVGLHDLPDEVFDTHGDRLAPVHARRARHFFGELARVRRGAARRCGRRVT